MGVLCLLHYQWLPGISERDVRNPTSNQCDENQVGRSGGDPGAGGGRCPPWGGAGGRRGRCNTGLTNCQAGSHRRGQREPAVLIRGLEASASSSLQRKLEVLVLRSQESPGLTFPRECGQYPAPPADTAHSPALSLTTPRQRDSQLSSQ